MTEKETAQLQADKAAISETASHYLHEIERLQAVLRKLVTDALLALGESHA